MSHFGPWLDVEKVSCEAKFRRRVAKQLTFQICADLKSVSQISLYRTLNSSYRKMAATEDVISELRSVLDGQRMAATFACGGKITTSPAQKDKYVSHTDVFMFYEDREGHAHRLNFPASDNDLETLASNCDPATFGVLNEERLDLEYRSAWKLDETKFLTSFHPGECDIMEIVGQILAPIPSNLGNHSAIVAELYKLNVCLPQRVSKARFIKGRMTSSSLTWILLGRRINSGLSSYVFRVLTQVFLVIETGSDFRWRVDGAT